jgi:peptide/nickel transport system permease protein
MILDEAALSFLGLGIQAPDVSWGLMLNEGQDYFRVAWWNALFPGIAIVYAGLVFNLLGDYLTTRSSQIQELSNV